MPCATWLSLSPRALQAYLGSDSEGEEQAGQEAVGMEEYRRRLLSGADDLAQRKGGKDWAPAPHNAQVCHLLSGAPSSKPWPHRENYFGRGWAVPLRSSPCLQSR